MEKPLKCVLLFSLKEMALRRVAVTLWSGSDILTPLLIASSASFSYRLQREAIVDRIKDKMLKLELPEFLTKQMIDIVRPISLEVIAWKESIPDCFMRALPNAIALLASVKLCWTTSGKINFRQTAEQLLLCDELDVKQRYEIACHYCLEDSVSLYWEELSEEEKRKYGWLPCLPYYWSRILNGARNSGRSLTSLHQSAFEYSTKEGYVTAAEYFFQKLTPEKREASLMRTARAVIDNRDGLLREMHSDLLCYLLSVMTPEQQMEIMKSHPFDVFLCFLCLPLRDLFLENAGLLWTFLPPSFYLCLTEEIFYHCVLGDFYFPNMFKEFFRESPQDFKKCFVEETQFNSSPGFHFLYEFFDREDSESISVMFRSLDAADRVTLVFHHRVFELFYNHIPENRWHLVEVCLREAALSKEEKGRLKDAFTEFLERKEYVNFFEFKTLFEFLDETSPSSDKRERGQKRKLENCSAE